MHSRAIGVGVVRIWRGIELLENGRKAALDGGEGVGEEEEHFRQFPGEVQNQHLLKSILDFAATF